MNNKKIFSLQTSEGLTLEELKSCPNFGGFDDRIGGGGDGIKHHFIEGVGVVWQEFNEETFFIDTESFFDFQEYWERCQS